MKARTLGKKLAKAAELLGELGAELDGLGGDDDDDAPPPRARSSRAAPVVGETTQIDEPEIGWRMGFIRMLDGRCPWCGERIENVTLQPATGITWSCAESCNP